MSAATPPGTVPVSPTEDISFDAAEAEGFRRAATTFPVGIWGLNPDWEGFSCPLAESVG